MLRFKAFRKETELARLYESIELVENRIEFLKKNTKPIDTSWDTFATKRDTHEIIDHFAARDPTPNKQYTQWMVSRYAKKDFRQEDLHLVSTTIGNFHRYKNRLEKKDINQYKGFRDVYHAVEPHVGTAASNREQERITKHQGAELVHDQDGIKVHKLLTKDAACHYGAGTKWCTAAKNHNMFDHYNNRGPLYVVHTPDKKKYQFHFQSGQFANEEDETQSPRLLVSKYPGLKNVEAFHNHGYDSLPFLPDHKVRGAVDGMLEDVAKSQTHLNDPILRQHIMSNANDEQTSRYIDVLNKAHKSHNTVVGPEYNEKHVTHASELMDHLFDPRDRIDRSQSHKNSRLKAIESFGHYGWVSSFVARNGTSDEIHKIIDVDAGRQNTMRANIDKIHADDIIREGGRATTRAIQFMSMIHDNPNINQSHLEKLATHPARDVSDLAKEKLEKIRNG